nr:core protein C [Hepacivirus rhabdomysis]
MTFKRVVTNKKNKNKSNNPRNVPRSRPRAKKLGVVVNGVYRPLYPVGPRISGPSGRRRPTRDYRYLGSNRGGRIPIIDPLLGAASELVFPRLNMVPNDPRLRSRNLGHVVDGALGLVGDVLQAVPIVGPLVGGLGHGIARGVRLVEDGVNFFTRPFGLVFFLILCLPVAVEP